MSRLEQFKAIYELGSFEDPVFIGTKQAAIKASKNQEDKVVQFGLPANVPIFSTLIDKHDTLKYPTKHFPDLRTEDIVFDHRPWPWSPTATRSSPSAKLICSLPGGWPTEDIGEPVAGSPFTVQLERICYGEYLGNRSCLLVIEFRFSTFPGLTRI